MSAFLFAATIIASSALLCSTQSESQDEASLINASLIPMSNNSVDQIGGFTEILQADCCDRELVDYINSYHFTAFSVSIGNAEGTCCVINRKLSSSKVIRVWSASKWVTGYIILSLIDRGQLSLDTPASDVLNWWTSDPSDRRSKVTIRHLLSQTAGMSMYKVFGVPVGLGLCLEGTTLTCAKHAYEHLFYAWPGDSFTYTESTFYVLGAVAMAVTGLSNFDNVFKEMIARPLGMNGCAFDKAVVTESTLKADPGGGLTCSADEYAKFLRAVYGRTLVSAELHKEAEQFHTTGASNMPFYNVMAGEGLMHYAFASWRECLDDRCAEEDGIKIHSMGAQGFYPWVWRKGRDSHWGILSHEGLLGVAPMAVSLIMRRVFPLARKAMEIMPTTSSTTTTTATTTTSADISHLVSGCERLAMHAEVAILVAIAGVLLRVVA